MCCGVPVARMAANGVGFDAEPWLALADAAAERRAALALARKRGFGPFGPERPDRRQREKQLAAMLRAGHPLDSAREMVDAASETAAEDWAAACDDEES
jgi:regulatory protein